MIQTEIRKKLLANSNISNLVGSRIYYVHLPQSPTYPCISFFRVSNPIAHDIDVQDPRFQFDAWSTKYSECINLAFHIREALQREKGMWGDYEVIRGIYMNEFDDYEPDTKLFHIGADYRIIYRDT